MQGDTPQPMQTRLNRRSLFLANAGLTPLDVRFWSESLIDLLSRVERGYGNGISQQ